MFVLTFKREGDLVDLHLKHWEKQAYILVSKVWIGKRGVLSGVSLAFSHLLNHLLRSMLMNLLLVFPSLLMKIFSWKFHHMPLHLPQNLIFALQHFSFRRKHFWGNFRIQRKWNFFFLNNYYEPFRRQKKCFEVNLESRQKTPLILL